MGDDKSITEKLTDVITKATDSVKSTMSNIVDTASQAAQYAMESNAEKISGQTVTELDPGQIGATTAAQVYLSDAAAMPAPLIPAQPALKRKRKPRTKLSFGKAPTANKSVAKKPTGKAGKKPAKKPAPKTPRKAAKKGVGRKSMKKAVKRSAGKTKKRSKR
jgi:hypothetical protein